MKSKSKTTDIDKESMRLEYAFEKGINFKDRIIQITGEIQDSSSFDYLDSALTEMERNSKKTITLKINSPGGSVYEALAMVGRIQASKCHIVTEGYGQIMSAAVLLLASGDRRRLSRFAWFMHHESSYEVSGKHSQIKQIIAQVEREEKHWAIAMEEFSSQPSTFWLENAKGIDFYISPDECLACGVVDELF